ncbi:hypothetical protein SD77_4227 [Bacillus badius]|uniref:Uncharacterized protein n=1 Tax=Bacillus badius TaxID=1455 RepID=A0ABR5AUY8_BACBA|nr:hypothetical protein SD78_0530 [Bacillus badius]KIL78547.1 hypothetical protein SD77_4227 [Bacillus badius]
MEWSSRYPVHFTSLTGKENGPPTVSVTLNTACPIKKEPSLAAAARDGCYILN